MTLGVLSAIVPVLAAAPGQAAGAAFSTSPGAPSSDEARGLTGVGGPDTSSPPRPAG
ncbi:hypothetical protein AB0L41_43370 [Amycolatopsis mediterranei]|uniref:hypothetical protein n=1 Tax=Amycolatopsis mediterranei TaxID=33910 RepID=UPI003448293D